MTITRFGMTPKAIEELITQRVAEALANYEATRAANALEAESLPDNIQGNVMSVEPTSLQDAIRLANSLMDQKLKGYAIKSDENKRKFESNQRDNRSQQPPFKRQNVGGSNVARAYTAGGNEGRVYVGPHPLCNKCKLHHVWPCTVKCRSCGKIGYLTRDCKPAVPTVVNQRASVVNQMSATCFKCGRQGHFKKDCPKLKNQNHGNKLVILEARGKVYAIGGGDANPRSNVVTGTFPLNNHYASILFDSGVDRSFVSTTFSTLLDIIPDTLDVSYAVELADGRIAETNTMLRGLFDVIIGMDWLANNHAVIVCDKKIIRIPFGDEILIVQGDRSDKGKKLTLSIISYMKTQNYMEKGCQVFMAEITVVILVRDRCPRGKDNLPRLPIRTNIVRLATASMVIQTGAFTHW
ncbi:putative reverse transcriptase domain-containing protein, partial [Tanacetum coccineum]